MAEAALVLGLSERHTYRIKAWIRKEGIKGVIHGNRGRRSDRKLPREIPRRIVELARGEGKAHIRTLRVCQPNFSPFAFIQYLIPRFMVY